MIIEKNIPGPIGGRNGRIKYPFREMEIGDSVFFPDEPKGSQSKPAMAARINATHWGWRFSSRKEGTGVRIWRVA